MQKMATRAELKQRAKTRIKHHYKTAFALNWLPLVVMLIGFLTLAVLFIMAALAASQHPDVASQTNGMSLQDAMDQTMSQNSTAQTVRVTVGGLLSTIIQTGASIGSLTWIRQDPDQPLQHPMRKQFQGFSRRFLPAIIVLYLLVLFATWLGYLLLIIPGIMCYFAFEFIYLLYVDEGKNNTYFSMLSASWDLMRGHKLELFVFHLSFFWWYLGIFLTAGLLLFYFIPYRNLALAAFYDQIYQQDQLATASIN